mmetsp:Transcript_24259/g.63632  ORF Transcript_24259/g.63632 Transcript_24259/m.63632 type:complete len:226 (-) Transcript_24259:2976-3653(-)
METESLGHVVDRQCSDVLDVAIEVREFGCVVNARRRKSVLVFQDLWAIKIGKDETDATSIVHIRNSPTVVGLGSSVSQRRIWNVVILVQKHLQLRHANLPVRLRKLIRNVPPKRPVAAPLLDESMEEAESHQHLSEGVLARFAFTARLLEPVSLKGKISAEHVRLQTLGWLVGHLQTILEHANREVRGRHRSEPKPKSICHLVWLQLLHEHLQSRHPRRRQMTVL